MKKIFLNGPNGEGKYAIVDDADYEFLKQWSWHLHESKFTNYARRVESNPKGSKNFYMHRVLMQTPKGMVTDHINRNGLDNRRKNLRVCTQAENMANARMRKDNTTGVTGVYKDKRPERNHVWFAWICVNKRNKFLGYFPTKKAAIQARKDAEKRLRPVPPQPLSPSSSMGVEEIAESFRV